MYAVYKNKAWYLDDSADKLIARDGSETIAIPWGDDDLIVDPTDGELESVGFFDKPDPPSAGGTPVPESETRAAADKLLIAETADVEVKSLCPEALEIGSQIRVPQNDSLDGRQLDGEVISKDARSATVRLESGETVRLVSKNIVPFRRA